MLKFFSEEARQERAEKRERDRADWQESLRKPYWCERFKGQYDAALYWNSFIADEFGEYWPLYVFNTATGDIVGTKWVFPGDVNDYSGLRKVAEHIIHEHETWSPVPIGEQPLRPKEVETK